MRTITTSWDDGHPADGRLSELLAKYDLKATFYIPRSNPEHAVMEENEIYALSRDFEIGGHTLHHTNLKKLNREDAIAEIRGCHRWLSDIVQEEPLSFCPPFGAFGDDSLAAIYQTGFRAIRTTDLLSTQLPPGRPEKPREGLLHTTLQAFPHTAFTYFKHLVIRRRFGSFNCWRHSGYSGDLLRLLEHYLQHIEENGGCFHLWGHSWEIEENNHWAMLEEVFRRISRLPGFTYVENRDLAQITF